MTRARESLICLEDTPYYHCVSRCVRRAFLCGQDKATGNCYEHRRQWVEDRIHLLADVFAIDVCAYAVMSNHTHLVLHIHLEKALSWSVDEVIERWHRLYSGVLLTQRYCNPVQRAVLSDAQLNTIYEIAEVWRSRLCSISWFMRCLNEYIAREANKEDQCTGRFWEGRFKSQALLDEKALAACMAYVDLNPVRAKMADTPEASEHTSIQYRINAAKSGKTPKRLMPFAGNLRADMPHGLPFRLTDYLELVDTTGRCLVKGKRGVVPKDTHPILDRINLSGVQWLKLTESFEKCFHCAAGSEAFLEQYKTRHGMARVPDRCSARVYMG